MSPHNAGGADMKETAIVLITLLLVPATAHGDGQIGLYASDTHDTYCVSGAGMYQVEMWVWCKPGTNGQMCAEFMVSYPSNVITSIVTNNEEINSVVLGDVASGVSVCYIDCQYEWNWPFHQTLYVTSAEKTVAKIVPHPQVGTYQFANCQSGFPIESCRNSPYMLFNYDESDPKCHMGGMNEATWGAIKSIYTD
jgi:hypothetical protein